MRHRLRQPPRRQFHDKDSPWRVRLRHLHHKWSMRRNSSPLAAERIRLCNGLGWPVHSS